MFTRALEKEIQIMSLAATEVVEEIVSEETDTEALKKIIHFARYLVASWDRVWTLAEKRLQVLEEAQRIMQSRDN